MFQLQFEESWQFDDLNFNNMAHSLRESEKGLSDMKMFAAIYDGQWRTEMRTPLATMNGLLDGEI